MLETTASEGQPPSNGYALLWFFILAFVLHIIALGITIAIPFIVLQLLPPWTPNIAAFIVISIILKEKNGIRKLVGKWGIWKIGIGWYLAALSPFAIALLSTALNISLGNPILGPDMPFSWITLVFWSIVSLITGATGEELGWRGFALPRLQSRYTALGSSIILGVFWGFWHLPIYLIAPLIGGQFDLLSFLRFLLFAVSTSIIITWIVNNAEGSVLVATIFHMSTNFSLILFTSTLGLIQPQWYHLVTTILYTIYAIIITIIFGYTRLSKKPSNRSIDN